MLRVLSPIVVCVAMAGVPVLTGCEHKTTDTTTVRKSDGTVDQKKTETKRDANGNVVEQKTTEHTNKP